MERQNYGQSPLWKNEPNMADDTLLTGCNIAAATVRKLEGAHSPWYSKISGFMRGTVALSGCVVTLSGCQRHFWMRIGTEERAPW